MMLFPRMVDHVVFCVNQFGYLYELITFGLQFIDDHRQRFGRMKGGIVKQHDGAFFHPACNPIVDLFGRQIFPVKTISVPYKGKPLSEALNTHND